MRGVVLAGLAVALWAKDPPPTFSRDVAPILYRQCAGCHHPGAVAPFSLVTYADASKRAALIATVTGHGFMPPWLPSRPRFQNERRLTPAEISTLQNWAATGAHSGNLVEAPPEPSFPEGWPLGTPGLAIRASNVSSVNRSLCPPTVPTSINASSSLCLPLRNDMSAPSTSGPVTLAWCTTPFYSRT